MPSNEHTSNVPFSKLWGDNFKSIEELNLAVQTALTSTLGEGKYSVVILQSSYVIKTSWKVDLVRYNIIAKL